MRESFRPLVTAVALLLLMPLVVFGANRVNLSQATKGGENLVIVPIEVTNAVEIAAMDIPLGFSEGVVLKEVDFAGTRVEYFDLKAARIDNDRREVVLGLFPQMSPVDKPDLAIGTGVVANLVFEVVDPLVEEITVSTIVTEFPSHALTFVYHDQSITEGSTIRKLEPEFKDQVISLSQSGSTLPESYALYQNYPNPFNPTTEIAFDLPAAGRVRLDIYNVLGQKVQSLIDEELSAGPHTVEWDGARFSSGVYFYRLEVGAYSDTRKMLMIK